MSRIRDVASQPVQTVSFQRRRGDSTPRPGSLSPGRLRERTGSPHSGAGAARRASACKAPREAPGGRVAEVATQASASSTLQETQGAGHPKSHPFLLLPLGSRREPRKAVQVGPAPHARPSRSPAPRSRP